MKERLEADKGQAGGLAGGHAGTARGDDREGRRPQGQRRGGKLQGQAPMMYAGQLGGVAWSAGRQGVGSEPQGSKRDMHGNMTWTAAARGQGQYPPHCQSVEAAKAAIAQFKKIVRDEFHTGAAKSIRFECVKTSTGVCETSHWLRYLLGKDCPIPIECIGTGEGRIWQKPTAEQFYGLSKGGIKLGCIRMHIPATQSRRSAAWASVQVHLTAGAEGARPVSIQSTKPVLLQLAKAWVLTLRPIKGPLQTQGKPEEDDFMGYRLVGEGWKGQGSDPSGR